MVPQISLVHALDCKTGGLVNLWPNEIGDELAQLASLAFTPSTISNEPKLFTTPLATLDPGQLINQSAVTNPPITPAAVTTISTPGPPAQPHHTQR